MKKLVLIFLFVQTLLFAQQTEFSTSDELSYLVKAPFFRKCQIGVDIYNITKKEIVFRHNEKLLFRPASNMKLITTATALTFLGADFKFRTEVKYDGEIKDSVLNGNLYFIGGFDPDFTSADLDTMIFQIKAKGVAKINGNIYADVSNMDSLFWGNGWMWDDDPFSDFPYMTPLIINDACVKAVVTPTNIGAKAEVELIPDSFFFKYKNNIITVDNDTSDIVVGRDWINRSDSLIFEGSIFVNAEDDTTKINLVNTNKYFLTLAKEGLATNGILFSGNCEVKITPQTAKTIAVEERSFKDIIVNLNKTSDNLSAEMTLRALAYNYFGKHASAKEGVKIIDSLITNVGLNPKDYRIVDGSGVSHYNLVSVELLNEILMYLEQYHPKLFKVLYNSLPIAGVDGTLKNRMKDGRAFNNVHAKTGTLSGVSSLSGYLHNKSGDLISFSINTQNFVGSAKEARMYQDKICEILANME